jgi:archaemetzincin
MKITLKLIGDIDKLIAEELKKILGHIFGCPMEITAKLDIPLKAYNQRRGQYLASVFLDILKASSIAQDEKVLGIVDTDLYSKGAGENNFVFGQADPDSSVAIISLYRLKQELPPDYSLFINRVAKEAVHELGHTFGLGHCARTKCVMHFSNSLHDVDLKGMTFCSQCHPKLIK